MTDYINDHVNDWSDTETLENFTKFLHRVRLLVELVQDEKGLVTGKQVFLICGDLMIESAVVPLEWPLIPVPSLEEKEVN